MIIVTVACIIDCKMTSTEEKKVKAHMKKYGVSMREAVINLYRNNEIDFYIEKPLFNDLPIDEILEADENGKMS